MTCRVCEQEASYVVHVIEGPCKCRTVLLCRNHLRTDVLDNILPTTRPAAIEHRPLGGPVETRPLVPKGKLN